MSCLIQSSHDSFCSSISSSNMCYSKDLYNNARWTQESCNETCTGHSMLGSVMAPELIFKGKAKLEKLLGFTVFSSEPKRNPSWNSRQAVVYFTILLLMPGYFKCNSREIPNYFKSFVKHEASQITLNTWLQTVWLLYETSMPGHLERLIFN